MLLNNAWKTDVNDVNGIQRRKHVDRPRLWESNISTGEWDEML